ncbi:MAG: MBL fold metallo-hydrolase [Actinomycetota bacterium]
MLHALTTGGRRTRSILALVLGLALVVAACSDDAETTEADQPSETTVAATTDDAEEAAPAEESDTEEADAESVDAESPARIDEVSDSGMRITIQEADGVTVHSLTAVEEVFANSTHVIETENSLVLVDTQFLLPNALEMRAYADALGKPIDRMFITHEHPDHFLGSEAFADLDLYALAEVSERIAAAGDAEIAEKQADFGTEAIASTFVTPEVVEPGTIEIDGVTMELEKVLDAEADFQLVVKLPDHGVAVVGDIVYSGVHLIVAGNPPTWIEALEGLKVDADRYPIVLAGHGMPTDPSAYDANIAYLTTVSELLGSVDNPDDYRQGLLDTYPERGMAPAVDFAIPFLFPES